MNPSTCPNWADPDTEYDQWRFEQDNIEETNMKPSRNIISTSIAGHEHTYMFTRNSRLPLHTFRKPTPDWWVTAVILLCAVVAMFI